MIAHPVAIDHEIAFRLYWEEPDEQAEAEMSSPSGVPVPTETEEQNDVAQFFEYPCGSIGE